MFSITARMDTKNRSLNEDTKSRLSKNSPSEEPQKGVKIRKIRKFHNLSSDHEQVT